MEDYRLTNLVSNIKKRGPEYSEESGRRTGGLGFEKKQKTSSSSGYGAHKFLSFQPASSDASNDGEEKSDWTKSEDAGGQTCFVDEPRPPLPTIDPRLKSGDLYSTANPEYARTEVVSPFPPPSGLRPSAGEFNTDTARRWTPQSTSTDNVAFLEPAVARHADLAPPPRPAQYSSFSRKMMQQLGYEEGKGLGARGDGIAEPIQQQENIGRLGLGMVDEHGAFVRRRHSIDLDRYVPHHQEPEWIPEPAVLPAYVPGPNGTSASFRDGLVVGTRDEARQVDYDEFCSNEVVNELFSTKSRLDPITKTSDGKKAFYFARERSNPYETVGKHFFMNRASLKMANLDAIYHLTSPRFMDQGQTLYFADVCAGPGGFTEYIMWRKKTPAPDFKGGARGFGFTLVGELDWKLKKFHPDAPHYNFTTFYGSSEDGDVTKATHIREFAELVSHETAGRGLDMMVADGGMSVEGEENDQEAKLRQLVLCQFIVALAVLKQHGTFMCKVFDLFLPFSNDLVYLLYRHFERVSIIKPFTSRPANSERYIVCENLLERSPAVVDYLLHVNELLHQFKNEGGDRDIIRLVRPELINAEFRDYMRQSNTIIGKDQTEALLTLYKYIEDRDLQPLDQEDVRRRCLIDWDIPLEPPPRTKREATAEEHAAAAAAAGDYAPRLVVHQPVANFDASYNGMKSKAMFEADQLARHKRSVYSSDWRPAPRSGHPREHEAHGHPPPGTDRQQHPGYQSWTPNFGAVRGGAEPARAAHSSPGGGSVQSAPAWAARAPQSPTYAPHSPTYAPHSPTYAPPQSPTYAPPQSPTYAPPPHREAQGNQSPTYAPPQQELHANRSPTYAPPSGYSQPAAPHHQAYTPSSPTFVPPQHSPPPRRQPERPAPEPRHEQHDRAAVPGHAGGAASHQKRPVARAPSHQQQSKPIQPPRPQPAWAVAVAAKAAEEPPKRKGVVQLRKPTGTSDEPTVALTGAALLAAAAKKRAMLAGPGAGSPASAPAAPRVPPRPPARR
eukprot:TRINITY_DN9001_c0_g1_i2.p1 TRINITY_DN9001_c0_g1~~TRINITY_DN9001_c0_g1_i2.p1  ORF type:complete len:1009 (+),score=234.28 TRINITY_DN9001_c0_g1_i2:119-3145(+)